MKKAQGFTLVELIIVIVILGILAVTAAPKFIDFTSDANKSAVNGLKGNIAGAMSVVRARAAVENKQKAGQTLKNNLKVEFGYPEASKAGLIDALEISADTKKTKEWIYAVVGTTVLLAQADKVTVAASSGAGDATGTEISNTKCYLTYSEATSETVGATIVATDVSEC